MRCIVSSFSVWCNVNDTVEDAATKINANLVHPTDKMRSMWGEKKWASSIITANVYYYYAKFIRIDGAQIIVMDIVHNKHEVITLSWDTRLWQAKEMIKKKRFPLEKEASETSNFFGQLRLLELPLERVLQIISVNCPLIRLQTEENRLYLNITTQ